MSLSSTTYTSYASSLSLSFILVPGLDPLNILKDRHGTVYEFGALLETFQFKDTAPSQKTASVSILISSIEAPL